MSILDDYGEWKSRREERIGTHSDRCHLRHDRCMIHRLAAALEEARLTDAEREAVADAADRYAELTPESRDTANTLRGLLERHCPVPENQPAVGQYTMTNDADRRPRLVMRGWRHFRCGACSAHFREPSRDHATPSGVECECGEWVFPYESHADVLLSYDPATGNLIGFTDYRQRLA